MSSICIYTWGRPIIYCIVSAGIQGVGGWERVWCSYVCRWKATALQRVFQGFYLYEGEWARLGVGEKKSSLSGFTAVYMQLSEGEKKKY